MSHADAVAVQRATDAADLPDDATVAGFALAALRCDGLDDADVCVRIVGRDEGAELNSTYRNGESATNVLAFPFELPPGVAVEDVEAPLGDVVLCADVARDEAAAQGKALEAHVAHLVVHGVLHLRGYDHLEDDEATVMEQREREVLAGLGIADPYAPS